MPPVNWNVFEVLPGGVESNFEMLCRALIRRHYGRYGSFAARAAQPGVEFHLKLQMPCALGDSGRWYGWQCRWYDLPGGRALGTVRRKKIEEAIATTEREIPGLTDWVLWTRRSLTAGDQTRFCGLKTPMRLHLWTAAEVQEHLSGEAEMLRGTYFGEFVLTPDTLADLHAKAVAPIRRRWQPEVHQTIAAISLAGPTGFGGHLLYLREDLVYQYAAGRQLIWFIWGERQLRPYPFFYPAPSWLVQAQNDGADVWRHLRKGDELSRSFASRSK